REVDPDRIPLALAAHGEGERVAKLAHVGDVAGAEVLASPHQRDARKLPDRALLETRGVVARARLAPGFVAAASPAAALLALLLRLLSVLRLRRGGAFGVAVGDGAGFRLRRSGLAS